AMWCLLPALLVALVWLMLEPVVIGGLIAAVLQDAAGPMTPGELDLLLNNVRNLAAAGTPPAPENPWSHAAARYSGYVDASRSWLTVVCTGTAAAAGLVAWRRVSLRLRARNKVESAMTGLLLAASSIAVL